MTGIHCHLPNLLNGQITIEKSNMGEVARYSCNDNYYLSGSKIRYCLNNGTWSNSQPECISEYPIYFRMYLLEYQWLMPIA